MEQIIQIIMKQGNISEKQTNQQIRYSKQTEHFYFDYYLLGADYIYFINIHFNIFLDI